MAHSDVGLFFALAAIPEWLERPRSRPASCSERGPMRLHMANIHLYRARLFFPPFQASKKFALPRHKPPECMDV